jgi:hypothetical protein
MVMAWSLPRSIATLRASRSAGANHDQALQTLRQSLARLPETEHPLGL